MSVEEIIEQIKSLPAREQLRVVEAALHDLREEFDNIKPRLERAAKEMRADYCEDAELTAFTSLDGEPFHA